MMSAEEVFDILRRRGYEEQETKDGLRVFYEFGKMDMLYSDCAKKFEVLYDGDAVLKMMMSLFIFNRTEFKEITSVEELKDSL